MSWYWLIGAMVIVGFYALLHVLQRYCLKVFAVVCVVFCIAGFYMGAWLIALLIFGEKALK